MAAERLAGASAVRRGAVAFILASLVAHGTGVLLLLPGAGGRKQAETPSVIEIELVDQAPQVLGAAVPTPSRPAPTPSRPTPRAKSELLPLPPPSPPAPKGQTAPAAVNLGGEQDQEGLVISGDNVVPPRPDARVRNKPPGYPAEAVRRRAEGTVRLLVHVNAAGVPAWIDVRDSSGDASLDSAAKEAVALWQFVPARNGEVAVPFDYELNIAFKLGDR